MKKRKCQKCGAIKPLTEFSVEPRIASGHLWKCKDCERFDGFLLNDSIKLGELKRRCR